MKLVSRARTGLAGNESGMVLAVDFAELVVDRNGLFVQATAREPIALLAVKCSAR